MTNTKHKSYLSPSSSCQMLLISIRPTLRSNAFDESDVVQMLAWVETRRDLHVNIFIYHIHAPYV